MYLAPFTYNRFFERVFKDPFIAKGLLEDILDVTIEELTCLPRKHQITEDASIVEFDYRCKIDGAYVIIDMQQWYKNDVVKRFYMYHCNNTTLQLEELPAVKIPLANGKFYKTKNYHRVEPAWTIIWMADDRLGFEDDFIIFSSLPEMLKDFVTQDALWKAGDIDKLAEQRDKLLKILKNDSKKLSFLSKNRLIFAFQKNIVKNKKLTKYLRWFEFAAKTSNPNNVEADFESYFDHPAILAAMKKLMTSELTHDDFQYITDYKAYAIGVDAYNRKIRLEGREEVLEEYEPIIQQYEQEKLEDQIKIQVAEQAKEQAVQEKIRAEQEKQQAEQEKQEAIQRSNQLEQEAQLKLEQTEKEAQLKLAQTEKEAKFKLEQTEKEAKLKLEQIEKSKNVLEKKQEKLEKTTKLKLQEAKKAQQKLEKEKQLAQKEAQLKLAKAEKDAFLKHELIVFKKMKQRGDTNEAIMAFMEIDKNTFQQYLKWIETK
jgi:hypothetical protein